MLSKLYCSVQYLYVCNKTNTYFNCNFFIIFCRSPRVGPFNDDITGFGSMDTIQKSCGGYGTPETPISFSNKSGNPFE